jgi:hypothetical protein
MCDMIILFQVDAGYLKHVYLVFERLGFERRNDSDWDVLWAHTYPFRVLYSSLKSLKPHQKVCTPSLCLECF